MAYSDKKADEEVTWADLKEVHEDLKEEWNSQFKEWQEKVNKYVGENGEIPADLEEQFDKLNDRLDELESMKNRFQSAIEQQQKEDEVPVESKAYKSFLRKGRRGTEREKLEKLEEAKALATDSDTDGGYLVPENERNQIIEKRRARSPVRQFATVLQISEGNQLRVPKEDDSDFEAGWTGERESRPETAHSGFKMLDIPTHEMYAKPLVTQQMLEDSAFPVEDWLEDKVSDKFSRKEASALVNGNGQNKPKGILQYSNADRQVKTGSDTGLTYDGLINLIYDHQIEEYVRNATMMLNRSTLADIRQIKDANNRPIWTPGLSENDPPSILGYEYFTATDMPVVNTGNDAIVFGDLSIAYFIVDRRDVRFLRDPYSSKPHIEFYYTTRVGGQAVLPEALRFHRVSA